MITSSLYDQILKHMPVPCVEAMIVINKSLLLLRRRNPPAQGEFWFAGGRIRKGESLKALFREVKEETGLRVTTYKLVNLYSRIFPERHDIAIVFLCTCDGHKIVLNDEHSEFGLFKEMPVDIHPYLLETIRDSSWRSTSNVIRGVPNFPLRARKRNVL
jgi:ADP-ribose pyrophosphatase YjhB (NUDIX family)